MRDVSDASGVRRERRYEPAGTHKVQRFPLAQAVPFDRNDGNFLKSFVRSKPSKYLLMATLSTVFATVALPFTPLGGIFGFSPLPLSFLLFIAAIVVLYIVAAELVKAVFYKKVKL